MFMLKKYLLPCCVIAALTACGGGQDLEYGPANTSIPDAPPPSPEYTPQWQFTDESDLDAWTIEWNKPGSANAEDSEIYWHETQFALGIMPHWGGESVAKNDNITVYGTLAEPVDLAFGTIYLSLYYPREHLGNPWGTNPFWGNSAHHMGTQYLVIDSNGNRALLDTGNGGNWINSFDVSTSPWQRTDPEARGDETGDAIDDLAQGYWFDLAIKVGDERGLEAGTHFFPNDDNTGDMDFTSIVSVGLVMQYALEFPDRNTDPDGFPQAAEYWEQFEGASERYIYIDGVALVPGEQPPPVPVEPPEALPDLPEFGTPIYRDSLESDYNNGWPASNATVNWASDYGVMTGSSSIAVSYESAGGLFQIGAPAETPDLSAFGTFDFSVWVESGSGNTKLWVSLCDCDDGIEVVLVEEEWNEISIPVADFEKDFLYGAIGFKNNSSGPRNIYIDDIGFDRVSDNIVTETLPVYFNDTVESAFQQYNGWGGTYDFASATQAEAGTSLEAAYVGQGGAAQIASAGDPIDISTQATLNLSAYSVGVETTVLVQLCNGSLGCGNDDGVQITVPADTWTQFALPVNSFPDNEGLLTEIRLKNYTDTDKTVYFDNIVFDPNIELIYITPVYLDALKDGYVQYNGWGGTYTFDSVEQANSGTNSLKAEYGGAGGALQIGVNEADIIKSTSFNFFAYAEPGSAGTILVQICQGGAGCGNANTDGVQITTVEGEWTYYSLPLESFPEIDRSGFSEIRFKNLTDNLTVYYDDIGFDQKGLPILTLPAYYDYVVTDAGFTQFNGWNGTYTFNSTENVQHGLNSIHAVFVAGNGGALQIGASNIDVSGYKTFNFSIVGAPGNLASSLRAQLCGSGGCSDAGIDVDIINGEWQTMNLDVSDFEGFDGVLTEIRFRTYAAEEVDVYIDTVGFK